MENQSQNPTNQNEQELDNPTTSLSADDVPAEVGKFNPQMTQASGNLGAAGAIPPVPPTPADAPMPPMPPMPMSESYDEAKEYQSNGSLRFDTGSLKHTPRLSISNVSGNISVRGADQDYISVHAHSDDKLIDISEVAEVVTDANGDFTVKVEPVQRAKKQVRRAREAFNMTRGNFFDSIAGLVEAVSGWDGWFSAADFEAVVPRNCDLYLSTSSGEITVEGVEGAIYIATSSGEIEGERIGGNVVVQTASGGAQINQISGKFGFKSASGDLGLERGNLTGLYFSSASGEANIDGYLHPGKYELRTVSGDINLAVQPDFAAQLTGRTVSGDFNCALPNRHADLPLDDEDDDDEDKPGGIDAKVDLVVDVPGFKWEYRNDGKRGGGKRRGRNRWEFLIGDPQAAMQGKTRLRIRTISGDLNIEKGSSRYQDAPATLDRQPVAGERDFTYPLQRDIADQVMSGVGRLEERARDIEQRARDMEQRMRDREQSRHDREQSRHDREQSRRDRDVRRPVPPVPPVPPQAGRPQDSEAARLSVLRAVENKQISIEEAVRLLAQLER